jgi:hypothetical protein
MQALLPLHRQCLHHHPRRQRHQHVSRLISRGSGLSLLCPETCFPTHKRSTQLPERRCLSTSRAGAPLYNSTFFCDGTATYCYLRSRAAASLNYANATAACTALGGGLVEYTSISEQNMVSGLPATHCLLLLRAPSAPPGARS